MPCFSMKHKRFIFAKIVTCKHCQFQAKKQQKKLKPAKLDSNLSNIG